MKNQKYVKDESWILPGVGKVFDALSKLLGKSKEWINYDFKWISYDPK